MWLRYAALAAMVVAASGCVQERVVHERRPVQREYVEVIAPQPPPVQVIEVEPPVRYGYVWSRGYWRWDGGRYVAVHGTGSRYAKAIAMCIRIGCNVMMGITGKAVAGFAEPWFHRQLALNRLLGAQEPNLPQ